MLFTTIEFGIFTFIVFVLYWFILNKNNKLQNLLLLLSSYFFYAFWDWRFLFLLIFNSFTNYIIGKFIHLSNKKKARKRWLILGLFLNIGVLIYFKYFNFFIESFINLFSKFGIILQYPSLSIILPIGISFYTFLSISYIIDVYQKKIANSVNIIHVLLALSFFPIILAGPIQRPVSLISQINNKRIFNYSFATNGLKQILWGLFMKVVIADRCALIVNQIFQNFSIHKGSTLLSGGLFYTIQVYSDFAGYSLIALGVSKLFGFDLMKNFAYPYFSRDITQFWKRWHISLTTWFRDYVFLPISYQLSRRFPSEKVLFIKTDIFIYFIGISLTWLLTGLWHGGNYTFVLWELLMDFSCLFTRY